MSSNGRAPSPTPSFDTNTDHPAAVESPPALTRVANSDQAMRDAYLRMIRQRHSPHTLRAYTRELARFYLWLEECDLTLSDLTRQHLESYERFVASPPPSLCGNPRHHPFSERRQPKTVAYALRQVSRFLDYCVSSDCIRANPLGRFSTHQAEASGDDTDGGLEFDRYFPPAAWAAICAVLEKPEMDLPERFNTPAERAWRQARRRWLVSITYHLGLRREEVASSIMGAFVKRNGHWSFAVVGKRRRRALLPVSNALLEELKAWRRLNSLPDVPYPQEQTPLVYNRSLTGSIGAGRIYDILTGVFAEAADRLMRDDPYEAERLRRGSPHWLRHTFATHIKNTGADLATQKRVTRHRNVQTLMRYQHSGDEEQRGAISGIPGIHDNKT